MKVKANYGISCDKGYFETGEVFEIDEKDLPMYGDAVTALEEPRKAEPEKKPEKAKVEKKESEQESEQEPEQESEPKAEDAAEPAQEKPATRSRKRRA